LLLTDSHSAIPVQSYRNGVRSVAIGQGNQNNLALLNVPETTDIRKGDLFVTSGLGQRYPVGYPVGVVIDKKHVPGEHFNLIVLRPKAHLDRTQQLLLAWPKERLFNETTKRS
jgi:rod shape-determining protein MreC